MADQIADWRQNTGSGRVMDPDIEGLIRRVGQRRRRARVWHAIAAILGGVLAVLGVVLAIDGGDWYQSDPETWAYALAGVAIGAALAIAWVATRAEIEAGELGETCERLAKRVAELELKLQSGSQDSAKEIAASIRRLAESQRPWWRKK